MCSSPHYQNERPILVLAVLYILAEYISNVKLARGIRMLNTRDLYTIPMFGNEPLACMQGVEMLAPFKRDIDGAKDP